MLVDLNPALASDGKVLQTDVSLEFEQVTSRMGTFPVVQAAPVSLKITNIGNKKLQITGDARVTVRIPCSRCLEDVDVCMELDLDREADMRMSEEDRIRALDEQAYITGYNLDVDKLVYSELLVNWPSKVLCREDCKGICRFCGTNLNRTACGCREEGLDPRMAKFQEIFNKFKEV